MFQKHWFVKFLKFFRIIDIEKKPISEREYYSILIKVKFDVYFLGLLYWVLNIMSVVSVFVLSVLATIFLAGTVKYNNGENPFTSYLNENRSSNYILLTAFINTIITFVSGTLSFFVINAKYVNSKDQYQKLELEKMLFDGNIDVYKNKDQKEKEYILYKRSIQIINYNRYRKDTLISMVKVDKKPEVKTKESKTNDSEK
ncbi:DUF4231 domain-containing protein [Mycoplasmopsis synoviae]|uniref:DUF4231 domain-containing protein n=1 Tax=Mycoplasmopsis synoviae TaxID=2109 RepID=UPI0035652779